MKGEVTKWFTEKGFGFIQGEDGESYFTHFKFIHNQETPKVGDKVKFTEVQADRGKQAHNVVIL